MKWNEIEVCYFIGIGGIGMSALARYFHAQGKQVMGYDKTSTPLTTELELEGIAVHFDDSVMEIPQLVKLSDKKKVLVIYTPAIPKDSAELNWFAEHEFVMMKRSQVLGLITENSRTIAVAGTHGKTTTSTLIAHILKHSGMGCNAFLGGISTNYGTNLLLADAQAWTVVEADEYDRSFLTLSPTVSIITSTDADHLDIYGSHEYLLESFQLFAGKTKSGGKLISKLELSIDASAFVIEAATYSILSAKADYYAANMRIVEGDYIFDLQTAQGGQQIDNMKLGLPGRHNVENAVAACAAALYVGVTPEQLRAALATFAGARRRFEYRIRRPDFVLIDDYAHHPEELRACISSVRELYPDKKITGVFQPHLFSRTRDFADEFATSLSMLDEIILLPIYPAREQPMEGVHSQMLLDKITKAEKILVEKTGLLAELKQKPRELVLMLGAGDIDALVTPVQQAYQ
ncbi:MAG: UDP-N-acetylmuramate--L-alanine ligase [Flavobacteriales bacterium]